MQMFNYFHLQQTACPYTLQNENKKRDHIHKTSNCAFSVRMYEKVMFLFVIGCAVSSQQHKLFVLVRVYMCVCDEMTSRRPYLLHTGYK